jgi:hypothetical protein
MNRAAFGLLMMTVTVLTATPEHVEAQIDVQVVLTWHGDEGWVPYRPAHTPRQVVYYDVPGPHVHVPPGHMPPPGHCRLWYPGVPPGHQPPPERCENLFGAHYLPPEAVIVGSPAYDVGYAGDRGRGRGRGSWKKGR